MNTRWPMIIIGVTGSMIAACLIVGGAVLLGAQLTLRDADGYYTSPNYGLSTNTYAVVLDGIDTDLERWAASPVRPSQLASIRVTTQTTGERAVFAGIARQSDITSYLADVAHEQIIDVNQGAVDTRVLGGSANPAPPGQQTFWVASSAGTGVQHLTWPLEDGRWSLVIMSLDGAASVDVVTSAGGRIAHLTPIAFTVLAVAALCLAGAMAAFRSPRPRRCPAAPGPHLADEHYPLTVSVGIDTVPGRWLWIVKWILLVPHVLILTVLWAAFALTTVTSAVSILLTGRYPRRLFDFNVGVLRWTWRVGHYSYLSLSTDRYPPFTLQPVPYPASLDVTYPAQLSRWQVLVKWVLVLPHLLVVGILVGSTFGLAAQGSRPLITGGLIGALVLIAAVHLAFLRRYPRGLFELLIGLNRWMFRVIIYLALMTDTYPPFRLDLGGTERPLQPVPAAEPKPLAFSSTP